MSPEKYGGRHGSVTSKESLPPPVLKESLYGANIQKVSDNSVFPSNTYSKWVTQMGSVVKLNYLYIYFLI